MTGIKQMKQTKQMKKIIVIGCPGGGKSFFSRRLHEKTGIPLYHLDMMYWNSDKTVVERDAFLSRLAQVLGTDEWIIDGNYSSTLDMRIEKCDTVFFLDLPTELCLVGVRQRIGRVRSDMPWVENEHDEEFLEYIKKFNERQRPQIVGLLEKHKNKNIVVFTSREQINAYFCEKNTQICK